MALILDKLKSLLSICPREESMEGMDIISVFLSSLCCRPVPSLSILFQFCSGHRHCRACCDSLGCMSVELFELSACVHT